MKDLRIEDHLADLEENFQRAVDFTKNSTL
jgi:hypothetical protein